MCNLVRPYLDNETFTGYKLVAKKDDKYYSSFTGQELIIGEVPLPPETCTRLSYIWVDDLDKDIFYNLDIFKSSYIGYTSVFHTMEDLYREFDYVDPSYVVNSEYELVVVKMTLSKELMIGEYEYTKIIAGKYIENIENVYNDYLE